MADENEIKIPTQYLPKGWEAKLAEKFSVSESFVKKVAYGQRQNTQVFDALLLMAEQGKLEEKERLDRLAALSKS